MAEEFQEADLLFAQTEELEEMNHFNLLDCSGSGSSTIECGSNTSKRKKTSNSKKKKKSSGPVNIPENVAGNRWIHYMESDFFEEDEMIPPHLILARRISGKMAFSVCTGIGRTLKGRDLSQVRNSILKMTGFLEA